MTVFEAQRFYQLGEPQFQDIFFFGQLCGSLYGQCLRILFENNGVHPEVNLADLIHYLQQTKADLTVPTFAAGLLTWLLGYRLLAWWRDTNELSTLHLLGLAVVVSVLTFAGEAIGIGIAFGVSPLRVLNTVFDFDAGIRPGWQVLAAGLLVVAIDAVRARWPRRTPRVRTAAAE